jgi:hypothetical protein
MGKSWLLSVLMSGSILTILDHHDFNWFFMLVAANLHANLVDVEVEFDYVAELGDELTIQVLNVF